MSKLTTCVTPGISRPRAATSVANISGHSSAVKRRSADSRSACCLSPCTPHVPKPSFQKTFSSMSTRRLVLAKQMTREPSPRSHRNLYSFASLTSSVACMKTCVTEVLASSSASGDVPMKTCRVFAVRSMVPASCRTDLGQVAVNMTVCLPAASAGNASTMILSCGANPMSSMRSASSSATCLQVCRLRAFWPSRSTSRPGVATTRAGRCLRSIAACSLEGTPPPKTHAVVRPSRPQYRSPCASICCASSRVGASTSPRTAGTPPSEAGAPLPSFASACRMGSKKPSVLPEPVLATAMRSLPSARMGHDCAWMGVGASKLLARAATTFGTKGALSNERLHGGSVEASPRSPAVICSFAR
mmetsp:Transcript_24514/g.58550  ORF Transcript_24514/g.58550 Transcript_24514/m.58550 type:complete len:359 (+) Transcript_24514:41-1117(+)